MQIEWTITKGRGNLRPVLTYSMTLSEYEISLCMPAVRIESSISKPPDAGWQHCWPGQNERGQWTPSEQYQLMTPTYRDRTVSHSIKLPWRKDNAYPEVEASFQALRDAFEAVLADSSDSAPLKRHGSLETSAHTKRHIAPAFAAARILHAVKAS